MVTIDISKDKKKKKELQHSMFPKQVTHAKQYELKTTTAAVVMTITSCTWQMSICGDTCQPKKKKEKKTAFEELGENQVSTVCWATQLRACRRTCLTSPSLSSTRHLTASPFLVKHMQPQGTYPVYLALVRCFLLFRRVSYYCYCVYLVL